MRSLARTTGLSVATISRVLNGASSVSASTRARVQQAMRESGYRPHAAARALATRRTRTIGAVVPTLAHSIFARFLHTVEIELARHGYGLVIATTEEGPAQALARVRDLLDLGAEALILSGARHDEALRALIAHADVPTICASTIHAPPGTIPIGYDNRALAGRAIDYLHSLGHDTITLLHGPTGDNDRTRERIVGAREAARDREVRLVCRETTLDVAGGVAATDKLLREGSRATALLCLSDVIALGVLFECARHGVAVPGTLSVMGFDDLDWAACAHPRLTTVALPTRTMGEHIAAALVERLENGTALVPLTLDATIVARESTRRR